MRNLNGVFRIFLLTCLISSLAVSCFEMEELAVRNSQYISFIADLQSNSDVKVKSFAPNISMESEEWTIDLATKVSITTKLNGEAKVLAYQYQDTFTEECTSWDIASNSSYEFNGDELISSNPVRWGQISPTNNKIKFFIYTPTYKEKTESETVPIPGAILPGFDGSTIVGTPKITYTLPANRNDHIDIITAVKEVSAKSTDPQFNKTIPLVFTHAFTGLKFKMGFACKVKSIAITGVYNHAVYTLGVGWSGHSKVLDANNGVNGTYAIDFGEGGKSFGVDENLIDDVMMMIPQTLPLGSSEDPRISVTYFGEDSSIKTISASLKGQKWEEGKLITYTLHKQESLEYIYFDLNAGNITIQLENGKYKYKGYVFKNEGTKTHLVTGDHNSQNRYYVYQSTSANKSNTGYSGDPASADGGGTFKVPSYERVTINKNGKLMLWSDFITNNKIVEDVIRAWDDSLGAGKTTSRTSGTKYSYNDPNAAGAKGAVRDANREATKNNISIAGDLGVVNLIIDNIYSTFQQPYNASRSKGGITFLPTYDGNSKLIINMVGDSRLGCIHYTNRNEGFNNELVFEGTGSLTVADADYFRMENPYGLTGYYSNRGCSVIGSNDDVNNGDHAYNITINSGVLFAGATKAEYCTAIGGGGNGYSRVNINGGVVTAVASGTGTAIGGGTGVSDAGGKGYVNIWNGNIYAYNHANCLNIPTSAIGGAGSNNKQGNEGIIKIYGGNIYAESGLGTAIGGGSSATKQGGPAFVYIYDGIVVAKSLALSSGIGGGSSGTQSTSSLNGGNATIEIGSTTGNPIVRTGSIGGGQKSGKNGKIGSAKVTIINGDIQAQFVMASSPDNVFNMKGGIIRNSYHTEEYRHIQNNGGAVYMEEGTFRMTGGTIKNCSADNGGAVYIKGTTTTSFTMVGGSIERSTAVNNGGAVYLEGGTVTLRGGSIINNLASQGNGGGICVVGGNFFMHDTTGVEAPIIENNAAYSRNHEGCGSGGGIYVASSEQNTSNIEVEILSGKIINNTSDRTGGGLSVDMASSNRQALVSVGKDSTITVDNPLISSNRASMFGGGLYVNGQNANIVINNGKIDGNITSGYVSNPNVANEGGMVTLNRGTVSHVVVTYLPNDNNATVKDLEGKTVDSRQLTQNIVTATNSKIVLPGTFERMGWIIEAWHTRPDYDDTKGRRIEVNETLNISSGLKLYAIWRYTGNN